MPWFLRKDGRDYCPLCWTEVPDEAKPDTTIPARLRLSGNHRLSIDPAEFERRMHSLSDRVLWEAILPASPALAEGAEAAGRGDGARAANALQEHWRTNAGAARLHALTGAPERHFLDSAEYRALLAPRPELRADVLRLAEEAADHRIGYGSFVHPFGPVVDFNHDFGTPGMKYGFHYWQWGVPLVSAYALSPSGRWAAAFGELFSQWYAQRDGVRDELANLDADVIWYELGIAVRTPFFIDAMLLLAQDRAFPAMAAADLLRTIIGHCRWLFECSSRNPFHAYNWPIQVALTLRHAGTVLPELREAPRWRAQADAVIAEHLRRDFLPDGGYQERTPNYTLYVLDLFATAARLLETHPAPGRVDAEAADRIIQGVRSATEKCLSAWAGLTTPLGLAPAVNDTRRNAPMAGALTAGDRDAAGAAASPPRESVLLPDTGFAVMRSDETRRARYLFLNLAPWSVHTHEDILSFECYADGAAIAVDPGLAAAGYGDADHAGWYRAARGHNMLCVEDADPVRHLARAEDVCWSTGPRMDFAAATHDGYRETYGVKHRRQVIFLRPHAWIIRDLAWSGRPGLALDWYLHTPLSLTDTESGWMSSGAPGLVVAAADAPRYGRRRGQGPADLEGLPGEPAHRLIDWVSYRWMTTGGSEPDEIAVLLAPGTASAALRREPGSPPGTAAFAVQIDARAFSVRVRHDGAEVEDR